jgi:hypothetical protein
MSNDFDIRVQVQEAPSSRVHFAFTYGSCAVDHLALEVGGVNHVIIDQTNTTNTCRSQVKRYGRPKAAQAYDQHGGSFELTLTIEPNLGNEQMA